MKRLWLAVGILCAVFAATLCSSFYLKGFTTDMTGLLTQAEAAAEAGDWARAEQLTEHSLDIWEKHDMYLYTFLRHADTDQVHTGFREVKEFLNCQEGGEYSAANARLIAQIELLYEMEQFSLKNLL